MFSNDTFALINFAKCNISFTVELNLSPNNFYKIKINIFSVIINATDNGRLEVLLNVEENQN